MSRSTEEPLRWLLPADNPHARSYIAALDGTGNSMVNDNPDNWSVVAKIAKQIETLENSGAQNIAGGYVEGTFTQEGLLRAPLRWADGRFGHSFDERVETASKAHPSDRHSREASSRDIRLEILPRLVRIAQKIIPDTISVFPHYRSTPFPFRGPPFPEFWLRETDQSLVGWVGSINPASAASQPDAPQSSG